MRKAYILEAHRYPAQLHRLVERLNDGSSEFFVHIDKKSDIRQFESLKSFGPILRFTGRADSAWGAWGSVQAALNGLKAIRDSGKYFDQAILLSGQDYPIKSNDDIDAFFEASPYGIFMDIFPIPNYDKWPGNDRGGWYRVDKYYIGLKWHEFLRSKFLNLLARYLPFLRRQMPNNMKPYTGSAWWSVDMYALNYILDYDAAHPEYRAFHQYTFVSDELFVQMMIANSTDERIRQSLCTDNLRFYLWAKSDSAHPNTLRKSDFPAIQASAKLFARKFDATVDSEILDRIDAEILYAKRPGQPAKDGVIVHG